jgi:hypothetical protein
MVLSNAIQSDAQSVEGVANTSQTDSPTAKKKHGCLIATIAIVVMFIIIIVIASSGGGESSSGDDVRAYTYAQIAVKDQLKSPSTAKFPSMRDATISHSGNTYTVKLYVDAQNSFGATVREYFTVNVELVSSNSYRILSITS